MLTCREATQLLSESMDHELPWRRRWSLWIHVWMCKYCSRFGRHLTWLRTLCRQHADAAPDQADSQALSSEARRRIKARVRDEIETMRKGHA